jgi:hypothetical protein
MLDKIILEKSTLISYSQDELSNIASSSNHLRAIVKNQNDFNDSFLGGSYKRGTMVKSISDVDVYFQYTGLGDSKAALARLRTCLSNYYPKTTVKRDNPSILVDFDRIPFNITPYKKDAYSQNINIPDSRLWGWQTTKFGELEASITALRGKNQKYIDLIKILKLWNANYKRNIRNFDIEWKVANMFVYPGSVSQSISDWLWTFFQNNGYYTDAQRFKGLMLNSTYNEATLKADWSKFIENK